MAHEDGNNGPLSQEMSSTISAARKTTGKTLVLYTKWLNVGPGLADV